MIDKNISLGFDNSLLSLIVDKIIPTKVVDSKIQNSVKYKQVVTSIKEVGIIEPPVVVADNKSKQSFILLDGHMRIAALKELNIREVTCLISSDDESFTYNKHINRIAPIQEHRMIKRAIERGVSEKKIARALNLDTKSLLNKYNLLDGICPEVVEMLKDKIIANKVFAFLKKMTPYRQIDAVELMNDVENYTIQYAKMLFLLTPKDQLAKPDNPKQIKGLSADKITRMENEMVVLQRDFQLIEEGYGKDVLNLTLAKNYLATLLGNAGVVKYLAKNNPEMLSEFQKSTEITSLEVGEVT